MNQKNGWNIKQVFLVVIVIVIAVYFRIYLLKLAGYSFDIGTFIKWADKTRELGIIGIYNRANAVSIDYPPLIPLVTSWWLTFTRSIKLNDIYGFKLFPTFAELVLTAIALIYALKSNIRYKSLMLALIILQPATAFITSGWGQVDAIMTLVIILGFLATERNNYLATILFTIALLLKPQALIAIFVYLLWILFKKSIKQFLTQLLLGMVIVAIIGSAFIANGGNFFPILWDSVSRYPYISMNAFNFWWVLYGNKAFSLSDSLGGITPKIQGLTLFVAFLSPAIYYLKNKTRGQAEIFLVTSYAYLIFFTFLTQMHERYLYPAVALLPFAIMANKKVPVIYLVLSITLLINCFVILESAFPQFHYLFIQNLNLLGNWTRIIGVVNVAVAIYLMVYFALTSLGSKTK